MPQMEPGTVLADRYRLDSILGRGGMGAVWRAHHLTLNAPLAIKFIDPELAQGADIMERFTREAQAAAALQGCPNVVHTIDHGLHDGVAFIAMELMQGEDLGTRLQRLSTLTATTTARILAQVGRAIARAHAAGIVHRDLKPDNIFLARDGEEEIAKVLDFGIAKILDDRLALGGGTRTGAVLGTPYYMSPEQAEGSTRLDHRTDIWALGVIACECLTGKRAFRGETLADLVLTICTRPLPVPSTLGTVPPGFDNWFAHSCARDPEARYGSVRSQLQALAEVCGLALTDGDRGTDFPLASEADPRSVPLHHPHATTVPVVTHSSETPAAAASRAGVYVAFAAILAALVSGGWFALSRMTPAQISEHAGSTPKELPQSEGAATGEGLDIPPPAAGPSASDTAKGTDKTANATGVTSVNAARFALPTPTSSSTNSASPLSSGEKDLTSKTPSGARPVKPRPQKSPRPEPAPRPKPSAGHWSGTDYGF